MVPRDRENWLQTALFELYQRNLGIDDLVVSILNSYQHDWNAVPRVKEFEKMLQIFKEVGYNNTYTFMHYATQ